MDNIYCHTYVSLLLVFAADYFTSQTYFRNRLDAFGVSHPKERKLGLKCKDQIFFSRKVKFQGSCLHNKNRQLMKAVATSMPACLVPHECDTKLLDSNLDAQAIQIESTNDETSVIEDREKLRRMRISKANKGNVPWNKGRKHSAGKGFKCTDYIESCFPVF